jgi:hypothetical protein
MNERKATELTEDSISATRDFIDQIELGCWASSNGSSCLQNAFSILRAL